MKKLLLLISAIILTGCASGYKKVNPNGIPYGAMDSFENIKFEYKYDVLQKKYARKAKKKEIHLLSVKITNSSNQEYILGKNLKVTNGVGNEILLLDTQQIYKPIKQNVATYLLYLLLTPVKLFQSTENDGIVEQEVIFPIGYVLGPGITALNMITASTANNKFKTELENYNLYDKTIKAGETVYGIIGIRSQGYTNLKIALK